MDLGAIANRLRQIGVSPETVLELVNRAQSVDAQSEPSSSIRRSPPDELISLSKSLRKALTALGDEPLPEDTLGRLARALLVDFRPLEGKPSRHIGKTAAFLSLDVPIGPQEIRIELESPDGRKVVFVSSKEMSEKELQDLSHELLLQLEGLRAKLVSVQPAPFTTLTEDSLPPALLEAELSDWERSLWRNPSWHHA